MAFNAAFFKEKSKHVSVIISPTEKEDDLEYATPFTRTKAPHSVSTTSASVDKEKKCRISPFSKQHQHANRDEPGTIYSTVSSEPQVQSDDLSYSTVSFSKHPVCSRVTSQTESTTYASIKHKSNI